MYCYNEMIWMENKKIVSPIGNQNYTHNTHTIHRIQSYVLFERIRNWFPNALGNLSIENFIFTLFVFLLYSNAVYETTNDK